MSVASVLQVRIQSLRVTRGFKTICSIFNDVGEGEPLQSIIARRSRGRLAWSLVRENARAGSHARHGRQAGSHSLDQLFSHGRRLHERPRPPPTLPPRTRPSREDSGFLARASPSCPAVPFEGLWLRERDPCLADARAEQHQLSDVHPSACQVVRQPTLWQPPSHSGVAVSRTHE